MDIASDWLRAASDSWASLPADDLLVPSAGIAECLGVPPFSSAERLAFGVLARLIGYRHSLALVVPGADGGTLRKALIYLHRMRYDARKGWIRMPWLNAGTLADRPHVIVWTKARKRFTEWIGTPGLQCFMEPATIPGADPDSYEAHTLILDPQGDVYRLFESMEAARISPFAILVDADLFGPTLPLDAFFMALREVFLGVPIVILSGPGEVSKLDGLRQLDCHTVVFRQEDVQRWDIHEGGRLIIPSWRILEIPDSWIDQRLTLAHDQYRTLQGLVQSDPDAHPVSLVKPLGKVLQSFRALSCDLSSLERELERHSRSGPFPLAPLARWLERTGEAGCRYPATRFAADQLTKTLRDLHKGITMGQTGKTQALMEGIRQSLGQGETLRVLLGSQSEVTALEHWLFNNEWGNAITDGVEFVAMDSIRGWTRANVPVDHLWIAGTPWPNRHRWLAASAGRVTLPCYSFEKSFIVRQLGVWWVQLGRASKKDGDKLRLWHLDFNDRLLRDSDTEDQESPIREELSSCRGRHPISPIPFELAFTDRHEDWMEQLLATHEPVQDAEEDTGLGTGDGENVLIHLEDRSRPLVWPRRISVQVLELGTDTEPLRDMLPEELKAGQQIVLIRTDSRGSILEVLFRAFAEDSVGLEQHLVFASKWQDLVREAYRKLGTLAAIRRYLTEAGISIAEATIGTWVRGQVIGPENLQVIPVFAKLCGWGQAPVRANRIGNAIKAVRTERRRLGHDLKAALKARASGAEKLRIGRAELDPMVLDELLSVETVVKVEMPEAPFRNAPLSCFSKSPPLTQLPEWVEERFPGRLIFTPAAHRALKDCLFRDVEMARRCLELMATRLFDAYLNGGRLHEVVMAFKEVGIDFAGGTARSTQGRSHSYDRRYKGRKVDIGAHLKLGMARDPTLTMRIHFHWDTEDRQLVIHHAGQHLPILGS